MFSKIKVVILLVSDMQRSINFYKNTLSLSLRSKTKGWTELVKDGTILALHYKKKFRPRSKKPKIGMLVAFRVSDMDEVYRMLKRKRVRFVKEPVEEDWGKHAIILDPDGYMISLAEPKIGEELEQAPGYHGFAPV